LAWLRGSSGRLVPPSPPTPTPFLCCMSSGGRLFALLTGELGCVSYCTCECAPVGKLRQSLFVPCLTPSAFVCCPASDVRVRGDPGNPVTAELSNR
jgi:hypothetical protein